MPELVTFIGRLLFKESSIFSFFNSNKYVEELFVEFNDEIISTKYKKNKDYKRKYTINKRITDHLEITVDTFQSENDIIFKLPKLKNNEWYSHYRYNYEFLKLGKNIKPHPSINNCEFVNKKDQLIFKICMSNLSRVFYVTYDKLTFSEDDIVDICGQIIEYNDI